MTQKLIYVRAKSPAQTFYEGEAFAVSSSNTEGNFDILSGHANFITIILGNPIRITKPDKSVVEIKPKQAILYVVSDKVFLYTDPEINR